MDKPTKDALEVAFAVLVILLIIWALFGTVVGMVAAYRAIF